MSKRSRGASGFIRKYRSSVARSESIDPLVSRLQQEIGVLLKQGLVLHQQGELEQAKALYDQVLIKDPRNFDGLHLQAVIACKTKNPSLAIRLIDQAIEINPNVAAAYFCCGNALQDLKRLDDALAFFDRAIALRSDYAEAYYNRGNVLKDLKRLDVAVASYDCVIALKPDWAEVYSNRGLALRDLKRWADALVSYDRAISLKPDFAEAYYNRGIVLRDLNRFDDALANHERAIALKPDWSEAYYNRGNALKDLGRLDEALASYDRAIAVKPYFFEAHSSRGNLLRDLERSDEALTSYDRAITLKPDYAEAYSNRGSVLRDLKRFDEALASYDRAIALNPDLVEAYSNRGLALNDLKRLDDALASFDRAITLKPDYAEAYSNRGLVLRDLKRLDDALASYDQALALNPGSVAAFSNRGLVLRDLKRLDDALASYDRAIALKPDYAEAYSNRGLVLTDLKRLDEALASYDQAIALKPSYAEAHWNKALALLLRASFSEGWPLYEWRWKLAGTEQGSLVAAAPMWDGTSRVDFLEVIAEQGVGDEIFCAGMFAELPRFADKIVVHVDTRLIELLQRSFVQDGIEFVQRGAPLSARSHKVFMGSLGRSFRSDAAAFSKVRGPYLKALSTRSAVLRAELASRPSLICGVSWSSKSAQIGSAKSLELPMLAPLIALPGTTWVNLQYGDTRGDQASLKARTGRELRNVHDVDNTNDLDGLAALIDACDVIVTTSNSTAHFAGALGKKTYVLLPHALGLHWYWHVGRQDSPWYPSLSLCRQESDCDWAAVVARVGSELQRLAAFWSN